MEVYFCAEDGVLNAWSLDVFYDDFTRRDWSFPGGAAIEIRGAALTHGRRLLGSKLVSNSMQANLVLCQGHVFIRQFPITNLAALDDIGGLCKRDLRAPQVVLVEFVRRDVRCLEIILEHFLLVMRSR